MKGNTLRVRRAERRISQLDLSREVGIGVNRFWRIENGYADPTDEERASIASALGVSEAEIWPDLAERNEKPQPAA